jgi:DNA-binding NarL/FixJ family response regulator
MCKIAIIESQPIFREGLFAQLTKHPNFDVICQYDDPIAFLRRTGTTGPDLVILDLCSPKMNGIEAIEEIKKRWQKVKMLVMTSRNNKDCIQRAFRAGAGGYIQKHATPEEFITAVKKVLDNQLFVSNEIFNKMIKDLQEPEETSTDDSLSARLTTRERELLKLIAEGHKNKEMADELCISLKTVEAHRSNLMKKLNAHSVVDLALMASRFGFIF